MTQDKLKRFVSALRVTVLNVSDIKPLPCWWLSFLSWFSFLPWFSFFYPRLFVSVTKGDQRFQTGISERARSVVWNKTFNFKKDAQPDEIQIELYRKKTDGSHILLDHLHEQLHSLELGTEIKRKFSSGTTITFKVTMISKPECIFALIVGINKYKSTKIESLKGCVNDACAMKSFLSSLQVPEANVCTLTDEGAAREAILSGFQNHLIENPRIEKGDPIIFFFAGHGSRVEAPKEWETSDGRIETICPYDEWTQDKDGKEISGIPSITINELFRTLAGEKGNNITAIFDSCHSGAIARDTTTKSSEELVARCTEGCPIRNPRLDADVRRPGRSANIKIPENFIYDSMSSHILLAACKREEQAYETTNQGEPYGAFTNALMQILNNASLDRMTYEELIKCLPSLPSQQTPQCGGSNTRKILFDTKVPPAENYKNSFPVTVKQRGSDSDCVEEYYEVEAGVIHGISIGTEFRIHSPDLQYLGVLVVKTVRAQSSMLIHRDTDAEIQVPLKGARAVVSNWKNDDLILKVYVNLDPQDRLGVFLELPKTMEEKLQKQCYARVPTREEAEIVLEYLPSQEVLEIERTDNIIGVHAEHKIRVPLPEGELHRMPFILDEIALFRYHLLRSHGVQKMIQDIGSSVIKDGEDGKVEMHLYRLSEWQGLGGRKPMGKTLFEGNRARTKSSEEERYGIKITNHTRHNFYPYLFYFDPSDYSIQAMSCPYSSQANPPLRALQSDEPGQVTVGYGLGGGDPIQLTCGDVPDTGFFKLFVSDVYVDMEHVAQRAAVGAAHKRKMFIKADDQDIWGCSLAVVTVTQPKAE